MRARMLIATAVAFATAGALAAPARAQDNGQDNGYSHGRLRYVEPGVSVQRATEVEADEAVANAPFLPGDRIWTDENGRAEFQFPDGTVVRLDRRSKLDYSGHEQENGERVVLRLWSGSLMLHVRARGDERFEIETPAGLVQGLRRSILRVDVDGGETRLSVYEGEAVLDDGGERPRLGAGERTAARWGARAQETERFERGESDDFLQWDLGRESEERRAADSARYLPGELGPYAGEFEDNGSWSYENGVGNVWIPRVEAGWQPYSNGQWSWTPYGWTWVPNERWGWAPFHYGRWGQSASLGWYWIPGRTWGPAWVSWAVGGGYVGWCPLGWHDRPVYGWGGHEYGRYSGNATTRGGRGVGQGGWNLVRQGELGGRNVSRRRVGLDGVDTGALQVADSPRLRPTRDGQQLREGGAVRAISRRPSMGDYVRELGVDNKTTIPAPWTRGYGPPPAGVDGARYGAQGRERGGEQDEAGQSRSGTATGAAPRQGMRSAPPSYAPPANSGTPSEGGVTTGESGARQRTPHVDPASDGASGKTTNGGSAGRQTGVWRAPEADSGGSRSRTDGSSRRSGGDSGGSTSRPTHESNGGSGRPSGGSSNSGASGNSGGSGHSGGSGNSGHSSSGSSSHPSSSGSNSSGSHATHRDHN